MTILTANDVADILQLDVKTVRNLLAQGKLPGTKLAKEWRVPKPALEEYLNEAAKKNRRKE